jgi:uncharacterized membrane protein YhaH (DUF805 family)
MSWGDIFFAFRGRIGRKAYWIASVLVAMAGLLFTALLSDLATGQPIAAAIWERPADQSRVWGPVWLAYFAFVLWPLSALAVKRLHDRDRPLWIWSAYYALSVALVLVPLKTTSGAEMSVAGQAVLIVLVLSTLYIFFELNVLRGTPGPNAYGADTLPADYRGGDYNFLSWMLALEGRIERSRWWLGFFILIGIVIAVSTATGLLLRYIVGHSPEGEENLAIAAWLNSRETTPLLLEFGLWTVFMLVAWSFIALGVKRLHDRGLSSWLILVVVLPWLGAAAAPALSRKLGLGDSIVPSALLLATASLIWSVLQFGILEGEIGPNRHGPDPRARY